MTEVRRQLARPFLVGGCRVAVLGEPTTYAYGAAGPGMGRGVGIDCVERRRVATAIGDCRFLATLCAPEELQAMATLRDADRGRFAARVFAAKEALLKAVGPHRCGPITPQDIALVDGPASLRVSDVAVRALCARGVDAIAIVVAEFPLHTVATALIAGTSACLSSPTMSSQ